LYFRSIRLLIFFLKFQVFSIFRPADWVNACRHIGVAYLHLVQEEGFLECFLVFSSVTARAQEPTKVFYSTTWPWRRRNYIPPKH